MQDNTITLAVDVANNATLVSKDFNRFDVYQNRSVYNSEDHTISSPDTLTFYRTVPKQSGNFKGQAKSAAKFSKNLTVVGVDGADVQAPLILEVSASIPVGATLAIQKEIRQRAIALLDRDDIMEPLMGLLEI